MYPTYKTPTIVKSKGDVDIDNSGLNSMKYKIHSIDTIYNRHKLINVRFNES